MEIDKVLYQSLTSVKGFAECHLCCPIRIDQFEEIQHKIQSAAGFSKSQLT